MPQEVYTAEGSVTEPHASSVILNFPVFSKPSHLIWRKSNDRLARSAEADIDV
ncbi:MAG: hypothetical protein QXI68_02930 [Sulfolobales archaeon]